MLSKRMKVAPQSVQIYGETHAELQIYPGDVPEKEIESELLEIVGRHNPGSHYGGDEIRAMGYEAFQKLYAQGPQLFKVSERHVDSDASDTRLGGMYVPHKKRDDIFKDLRAAGYEIDE